MIKGEPLYWIYYSGKFVGCIFYIFHELALNEYKLINDGEELQEWLKVNIDNYRVKDEYKIDLTDTSHEDYEFIMKVIRKEN